MKDILPKPISEALKSEVQKSNKSRYEIAQAIKMDPNTFNAWMRGERTIPLDSADAIANYLGTKSLKLAHNKGVSLYSINLEHQRAILTVRCLCRVTATQIVVEKSVDEDKEIIEALPLRFNLANGK